jgi:hypothetical protein
MKAWHRSLFLILIVMGRAHAQQVAIDPQIRTSRFPAQKVTVIDVVAHFVTTIRVPEPVNSVVVGDPALFQVEHSEREPELVFVKSLREDGARSNLLISTIRGRQLSFLLLNHAKEANFSRVDFLFQYAASRGFLI